MKTMLARFGVAAAVMLAPFALHAQTYNTVYGQTTIALNPAFTQQLSSSGATITDLNGNALPNGTLTLNTIQGVLDLQTAFGEVFFSGGYQVTVPGYTIRVQDLTLSIQNSTTALISGVFVVNGSFLGRQTIFTVNQIPAGAITLPLKPQNGSVAINGVSLGLSQYFINLINGAVGQSAITGGTQVATTNLAVVVAPPPGS